MSQINQLDSPEDFFSLNCYFRLRPEAAQTRRPTILVKAVRILPMVQGVVEVVLWGLVGLYSQSVARDE